MSHYTMPYKYGKSTRQHNTVLKSDHSLQLYFIDVRKAISVLNEYTGSGGWF